MVATLVYAAAYAVGFITEMYAANAIFAMAVNFAVSYTVTRVFGSKPPRQQDNGVRQQVPPSANNSIPVVYGDAWMGGTFVDAVLTSDNQAMYYVLAISNISPNGQFTYDTTQFYYGDRLVTFAPGTNQVASLTDGAGNVDTKINGYLYINLYTSNAAGTITTVLGSAPNVAMGGADIPVGLRWPASGRQMNGLAFAIVYLKYSQDAGSTGLQPVTFKVKHALNGTGVAKPGSVLQDYLTNTVYGGAVDISNVNTTACAALDTYSDQVITYNLAGGGTATQPRYRINGVIDTGETVLNNIENILLACDSWISYQAETGQWSPVINKADASGFAFDDSNIIGEIRVSATDITSSINQIEASFPWKENKDKPGYVFLETPAGLRYPNEPDNKYTMSFTMVNDSVQAEYLANRMLEQAREDLVVSFSTAYTGIQVNAGDVISVTNSAYGWTNKLFRAIKVNEASLPDGNLGARIECTEYNAAVYDDYNITAFAPAPNSGLQSGYYFPALAAPTITDQAPSAQPPTFSVVCQLPSTVRVTKVTLYYTTSATPTTADWKVWGTETVSNAAAFAPGLALKFPNVNLAPATYYFAFSVENEISTSQLSATSTALIWSPVSPSGVKTAIAYLYQWAASQPGNPSGTSTFTWATATNSGYTGGNGWSTTVPVNPGTAGVSLWVAAKEVSEPSAVATTTVSWTSGFSVYAQSTNGANGAPGAAGNQYADAYLYQWSATTPGNPGGQSTYNWTTGTNTSYTGGNGWSTTIPANPGTPGIYLWTATKQVSAPGGTSTTIVSWTSGFSIVASSANGANGSPGAAGNQYADAFLYQWSPTTPGNPNGQSTYDWTTGTNTSYTGGNGWVTTLPANPGTPGIYLWTATKPVTASGGTSSTVVSWASGFTVIASSANGATGPTGSKTAKASAYQWAASLPAGPTGTSTYTWSTGTYTPDPSGWSSSITSSPSAGFTLWEATVSLIDANSATTTTINWTTASIIAAGYAGTQGTPGAPGAPGAAGSSARICFARVPNNPAPVAGTITTSGSTSFPSSAQSSSTWGFAATWGASDPNPSSTDSLYQSDGIYDPTTGNTVWSTPYISSLKVGTLSAITVNTGALTVQNTLTVNTLGSIRGGQTDYNTGTGFFLGYSSTAYKFSIGDSFTNMLWDGSSFSINNGTITGSLIQTNTSGSRIALGTNIGQSSTTALVGYSSSNTRVMEFNIGFGYVSATRQSGTGPAGSFQNSVAAQALEGISTSSSGTGVYGLGGDRGVEGSAGTSAGWGGYFYNLYAATQGLYASGIQMPQGAEFRWRNASGGIGSYVYTDGNDALYIISGASGSGNPKAVLIGTKATARVRVEDTFLRPEVDNVVTLGAASFRFTDVYAVSGSVNTSDERQKNILGPNPLGLDFINALQTIQYKWKVAQGAVVNNILDEDGKIIGQEEVVPAREGVRTFHGLNAQQVKATLDALGVESFAGWVLADKDDPNSTQGLRYSEFIAPLIKAVQELSQKVADLEARLK